MSIYVKVPVLPESVSDATVATWYKKPGDFVKRDENLVDLETDKVVLEVPAPADGVLESIAVESGEVVEANQVLGVVKEGEIPAEKTEESVAPKAGSGVKDNANMGTSSESSVQKDQPKGEVNTGNAGPAARKMMHENNIDASQVSGSGRGGRITKPDVQTVANTPMEERVPMSRLRQKIADRMVEAQSTAAMLTSFNEDRKSVV